MPIPEKKLALLSGPSVICENPDSPYNYFAWPTVTRLPDGRLMLVSSGFRMRHVCPFGKVAACYSEDEGETWSAPVALISSPLDDRDTGIAVAGNRVAITTFTHSVEYQRNANEEDGDEVRKKLVIAHLDTIDAEAAEKVYLGSLFSLSVDGGKTFATPVKVPVSAPHGPSVTPDGKFLYVGAYFDENVNMEEGADYATIGVYKENETGEFIHLADIPNIPSEAHGPLYSCEPHSIVLPDGKIIVHIRAERFVEGKSPAGLGWEAFTLYQSVSTDGGKTFSAPTPLFDDILGGAPSHLYRHSSGALIASYAWRDYVNDVPSAVCVFISRDDGESWEPHFLCHGEHPWDMGYPATVERADGTLLTVFYDHKGDGPAVIKQITWSL